MIVIEKKFGISDELKMKNLFAWIVRHKSDNYTDR